MDKFSSRIWICNVIGDDSVYCIGNVYMWGRMRTGIWFDIVNRGTGDGPFVEEAVHRQRLREIGSVTIFDMTLVMKRFGFSMVCGMEDSITQ